MQYTEKEIGEAIVNDAIKLGYSVSVFDGEDFAIKRSNDAGAILAAMYSTDEDKLHFYRDDKMVGWVWLVYGNGNDVITDCSVSAEMIPILSRAESMAA